VGVACQEKSGKGTDKKVLVQRRSVCCGSMEGAGDDIVLAGGRTLPRSASQRVLELAGAGKTHMQIAKNYTLADYDLGADDVKLVLEKMPATEKPLPSESPRPQMTRLGNPSAAPAVFKYEAGSHSGEKLEKTYRWGPIGRLQRVSRFEPLA
jgi:hypothetical protein